MTNDAQTDKPEPTRIVVTLSQGGVTTVFSRDPTLDVEVLDGDQFEAEPEEFEGPDDQTFEDLVTRATEGMTPVW